MKTIKTILILFLTVASGFSATIADLTATTDPGVGSVLWLVDPNLAHPQDRKITIPNLRTEMGLSTIAGAEGVWTVNLLTSTEGDAAYQPLDADLTSIAALTTTAFGRGLLDDADAAAGRTSLGVVIGTDVQAFDADLTDLADGSLTGTKAGFSDPDSLYTATNLEAAIAELNDSINAGAANGTGAKVHWSQLLGVPAGFADGTDDGSGGSTTFDTIGDSAASGVIAFAGFTNQFTSTLDGGIVLSLYNTDADNASDTILLDLAFNDSGDANSIFIRARRDIDGTPTTVFQVDDSGGATFGTGNGQIDVGSAGVRITSDGDGAITFLGLGNGSDEDLTINLDDTANTIVLSSSTGVTAFDFGTIGADFDSASLKIPTGADPDLTVEGQISYDSNGDVLRAYDGSAQVAIGRKIEAIHVTVIAPNDLADAQRDAFLFWSNESGMSFVITGWKGWSGTDDTTLNIEKVDADGVGTNTTVDAVELATGTGPYTGSDTTITSATIENGKMLQLDFDDTDTPTYVKFTIYGYYAADVN